MSTIISARPNYTFVESNISPQELLHHIVRNSPGTNMFDDDFHLGVIGEASILLLEAKMSRVKVYDKRRRLSREFLQNVGSGFHLKKHNCQLISCR